MWTFTSLRNTSGMSYIFCKVLARWTWYLNFKKVGEFLSSYLYYLVLDHLGSYGNLFSSVITEDVRSPMYYNRKGLYHSVWTLLNSKLFLILVNLLNIILFNSSNLIFALHYNGLLSYGLVRDRAIYPALLRYTTSYQANIALDPCLGKSFTGMYI